MPFIAIFVRKEEMTLFTALKQKYTLFVYLLDFGVDKKAVHRLCFEAQPAGTEKEGEREFADAVHFVGDPLFADRSGPKVIALVR